MRITIIGTGYVGLVTGACLADFGHQVTCIDSDSSKINSLRTGHIHFYEPKLQSLVIQGIERHQLDFSDNLLQNVSEAELLMIAVGTPTDSLTGGADLSSLYEAIFSAIPHLPEFCPIIIKSTIPVGASRQLLILLQELHPKKSFTLIAHPEFLREGTAIHDFYNPARLVIGMNEPKSGDLRVLFDILYSPLIEKNVPVLFTDFETAEIIKYASNGFLATKIAFINEMADLCEASGGNIQQVAEGMGLDPRIGNQFLEAGPGFGGSCFPKDLMALTHLTYKLGVPCRLSEAVYASNIDRKNALSRKIIRALGGCVQGKTITVLGLTFKANTDDMREAPSLTLIPALQTAGAKIQAYDPAGMEQAQLYLENITYATTPYMAALGAEALVILTEWPEFFQLDLNRIAQGMKNPLIIDLRNLIDDIAAAEAGFTYVSVGRSVRGNRLANEIAPNKKAQC